MTRQLPKVWRSKSLGLGEKTRIEQLARGVDFNERSIFEWHATELAPYNQLLVDFTLANPSSGAADVKLRVAGVDGGYDYTLMTPTGIVQRTDDDAFQVTVLSTGSHHTGRILISSQNPLAPTRPTVTANVTGYGNGGWLNSGRLNQEMDHVDKLFIWSSAPVTGKVVVLGELI